MVPNASLGSTFELLAKILESQDLHIAVPLWSSGTATRKQFSSLRTADAGDGRPVGARVQFSNSHTPKVAGTSWSCTYQLLQRRCERARRPGIRCRQKPSILWPSTAQ